MNKIGFVGVGRMGGNMARRLRDLHCPIAAVYDARQEVAEKVAREVSAVPCRTLADVTRLSEVILTVVTDDDSMRSIFGLDGRADHLLKNSRGRIFINCATISPAVHGAVEEAATKEGANALEACMASSIAQAREGSLCLMVAGDEQVFRKVEPLLRKLSAALRHVGPTGEAAKVKAIVNMVMNINTAGLAEGLALGHALGLDLSMLREILSQTGAASRVLETDGEDMQHREHACFFSAAHAAKDSGIAVELGRAAGLNLPLAKAAKQQYDQMIASGLGELDKSGIAELTFRDRQGSHLEKQPAN